MIVTKGFIAEGTTCRGCEEIIKRQAGKVEGVKDVSFDYSKETGQVTFDDEKTNLDEILYKIEEKNYACYILDETTKNNATKKALGWTFGVIGTAIIAYFLFNFIDTISFPQLSQNMGYGLLFVVGLLTGFHCISMCGGFVVSYTAKNAQAGRSHHKSHLMYGTGKIISYTIIGAAFGLLGSIIAFTPMMRGVVGMIAGTFLVLFGLRMLNIFPILRKFSFRTPRFIAKITGSKENSSPLVIGLLNGLMIACGPLQAIYIMAAGTGSMIEGAKLLFVFAAGTLPVMIGFGYFASFVSSKMTQKILKASGVIVIILGLFMLNNGLVLTGTGIDATSLVTSVSASSGDKVTGNTVSEEGYQIIRMTVDRYGWSPDSFVLKTGVPVKWIIDGKEITGCNNAIQVPKYNLEFGINSGEQTIEFTPTEEGVVRWSCWMGMIPGTFIVKDNVDLTDTVAVQKEIESVPQQKAGSCGGSCGSSTCGAAKGGSCGCGG